MGKYCYYDQEEDVIFVDANGQVGQIKVIDAIFDEVIALAKSLPHKVYVLTHWKDVKFDLSEPSVEQYGKRLAELLEYTKGVLRYEATNTATRVVLRSESLKLDNPSNLYSSREAALEVVRASRH